MLYVDMSADVSDISNVPWVREEQGITGVWQMAALRAASADLRKIQNWPLELPYA